MGCCHHDLAKKTEKKQTMYSTEPRGQRIKAGQVITEARSTWSDGPEMRQIKRQDISQQKRWLAEKEHKAAVVGSHSPPPPPCSPGVTLCLHPVCVSVCGCRPGLHQWSLSCWDAPAARSAEPPPAVQNLSFGLSLHSPELSEFLPLALMFFLMSAF